MKAMLVADSDSAARAVSHYIVPLGFDLIQYRSPVKALDNLPEIEPDAVFISAGDFPRHWKTLVQFIRSDTGKDKTVVILLVSDRFSGDDADKALHIGVQAIVGETLEASGDEPKLAEVFSRYKPIESPGVSRRFEYEPVCERGAFMFTNPISDAIVTGRLESVNTEGIRFRPDVASAVADLSEGDTLDECSLKLDGTIISPECRVVKGGNLMTLEFVSLKDRERALLESFIGGRE